MEIDSISTAGVGLINKRITWGELEEFTWGEFEKMQNSTASSDNPGGNPKCIICFRDGLMYKKAAAEIASKVDRDVESNTSIEIDRSIDGYPMPINLMIPAFVMLSFSCELFAKSIVYAKNDSASIKTHDLTKLIGSIDGEIIDKIRKEAESCGAKWSELDNFKDPFLKYRYVFEIPAETIDTSFIKSLSHSLETIARDEIVRSLG